MEVIVLIGMGAIWVANLDILTFCGCQNGDILTWGRFDLGAFWLATGYELSWTNFNIELVQMFFADRRVPLQNVILYNWAHIHKHTI
jgi:hypothetical protein